MSKPVFEDLFRFSGRRNRKSYFLYSVCFLVVLLVEWGLDFRFDSGGSRHIVQWVMWGLAFRLSDSEGWSTFVLAFFLTALIAITVAVSGLAVASQRCRRDSRLDGMGSFSNPHPIRRVVFRGGNHLCTGHLGAKQLRT